MTDKWYENLNSLKEFVSFLDFLVEAEEIAPDEKLNILEHPNIFQFMFELYRKEILGEIIENEEATLKLEDLDNTRVMIVKEKNENMTINKIGKILSITA